MLLDLSAKYSFNEFNAIVSDCGGICPACNGAVRYRFVSGDVYLSRYDDAVLCNSCDFKIAFHTGYNKDGIELNIEKIEWSRFALVLHWDYIGLYGPGIPRTIRLQSSPIVNLPDVLKKIKKMALLS